MKSFDTEIKKYSEKIALKASEKRMLRERLVSYMEYHPRTKNLSHAKTAAAPRGIASESFIIFRFSPFQLRVMSGVFVLLLVIMPFAAERSVPGDVLYLVKTGFNETIQAGLASSPYEKIEFETKLMERRIAEARTLASEGKLTEAVQAQLEETVKEHTDAVQSSLAELRTQDADGAALAQISFNASLEVQSAVLGDEENATNTDAIASLLTVVNEARQETETQQGTTTPSFEGLIAKVELETTRAYELFKAVKITATPAEVNDIERRLKDTERLIVEGKELHGRNPEKAASDLAKTLGLLQKLIVFMTNIDVRETVALETIVPVMLSDAERIDLVKESLRALSEVHVRVKQRMGTLAGEGLVSKATEGVAQVDDMFLAVDIAVQARDVETAEGLVTQMRALLEDLDGMTERGERGEKPTEVVEPPLPTDASGTTSPEVSEETAPEVE